MMIKDTIFLILICRNSSSKKLFLGLGALIEPCHVLCLENGKKRCKSQDDEDKCDNKV